MKNNTFKEIFEKIKSSKRILIPLHRGPDGDSLGCCMAMKYFLERDFDKKIKVFSKDGLPAELKCFNFVNEVEFRKKIEKIDLKEFDLLLFLDHGTLGYFKDNLKVNFPIENVINMDHHTTNTYFAGLNYVDDLRPSACSVLLDFFRQMKINFDKELSTRLLLGIYTDSGGFSHDKGDSLKDAVFLIDKGADYLKGVVNNLKYNIPLTKKKYFSLLVDVFKIIEFERYKIGVSSLSKEEINKLGINLSEIRGGINYLQEIEGVDIFFTLAEMEDYIKGSFRSRKKINVSLFAKELGGGGHKFAAAFRLPLMPLEGAEKKVLKAIKKVGIHKVE